MMLSDNFFWWQKIRIELQKIRREMTVFLFAQIAIAVVDWFMIVNSTFVVIFNDVDAALQLSNDNVWFWMINFFLHVKIIEMIFVFKFS